MIYITSNPPSMRRQDANGNPQDMCLEFIRTPEEDESADQKKALLIQKAARMATQTSANEGTPLSEVAGRFANLSKDAKIVPVSPQEVGSLCLLLTEYGTSIALQGANGERPTAGADYETLSTAREVARILSDEMLMLNAQRQVMPDDQLSI